MIKTIVIIVGSFFLLPQGFCYDVAGAETAVEYIYSPADGKGPYITFGDNSLPGCYANKGAYLMMLDEKATARVYSLLLNGWGLCTIEAVDLR